MTEVRFYGKEYEPGTELTYSVIASRYDGRWIFVRHHRRDTFEIAGGHIEPGETADEAARRELMEETGALRFSIDCLATYSVTKEGLTGWGRLYFAEVEELGPIPDVSEIEEIVLLGTIPDNPTHPDIQPHLFRRVSEYLAGS